MRLIFLYGPSASGKLTTARALAARLGYPVFHNHLVVDLLTNLFPFGSPPFVRLREQMWTSVFTEAAAADTSLIFTFTPGPDRDSGVSRADRGRRPRRGWAGVLRTAAGRGG